MGVITMKMISSTSITSTMGVTLMSETTGGAFFFSITAPFFLNCFLNRLRRAARAGRGATGFQLAEKNYLALVRCDRFRK